MKANFFSNFWSVVKGLKKPVWIILALVIGAGVFLVTELSGCSGSQPVIIQNQLVHCTNKIEGNNGELHFLGCKVDGKMDAKAPATSNEPKEKSIDGGSSVLVPWPAPGRSRLAALLN